MHSMRRGNPGFLAGLRSIDRDCVDRLDLENDRG